MTNIQWVQGNPLLALYKINKEIPMIQQQENLKATGKVRIVKTNAQAVTVPTRSESVIATVGADE